MKKLNQVCLIPLKAKCIPDFIPSRVVDIYLKTRAGMGLSSGFQARLNKSPSGKHYGLLCKAKKLWASRAQTIFPQFTNEASPASFVNWIASKARSPKKIKARSSSIKENLFFKTCWLSRDSQNNKLSRSCFSKKSKVVEREIFFLDFVHRRRFETLLRPSLKKTSERSNLLCTHIERACAGSLA